MADFALCWVTLCRYLFSVTPTPFCELGNVCRRSGDVNFALCWHQPGQLIWTNTSLSGNDTKVIALFLQIASVFSCTVGRQPLWLLTKIVIDLDFTKFVWTRDYNKSSKIWQGWFKTYQSWTQSTKSENFVTFPERTKEKFELCCPPIHSYSSVWYHGLLFSKPGFRIRMGWAANSASRHPDSTSIRASALQLIAFISLSLDLVASRRPTLILEKDSSVQKLEHHSHSQHNILGRKSWNWKIQMIIRHKSNCLEIFVNYLVMINTALTDGLLVRKLERSLCLK